MFSDNIEVADERAMPGVIERNDVEGSECVVESEDVQNDIGEHQTQGGLREDNERMEETVVDTPAESDPLHQLLHCADFQLQDGLAGKCRIKNV